MKGLHQMARFARIGTANDGTSSRPPGLATTRYFCSRPVLAARGFFYKSILSIKCLVSRAISDASYTASKLSNIPSSLLISV